MLISEVKTAFKIAEVAYIPNSTKLEFKYKHSFQILRFGFVGIHFRFLVGVSH
jgi:hypothetical protein